MAIDYIEVRSAETREIIGIIDGAQSVIWHNVYYGTGDFEIYISASANNVELLQVGNYVTKPCLDVDAVIWQNEPGIIEHIEVTNTVADGRMILASGRFAKSILDRRHIYQLDGHTNTPTILRGNVEGAAWGLVINNAMACSFDSRRNIDFLDTGRYKNYDERIVDQYGYAAQKQVSFQNLLDYLTSFLEEYGMSCQLLLYPEDLKLRFEVYKGINRSADNTDGNDPVIFSTEFDNLAESNYLFDETTWKNTALIGGEGEGLERFFSLLAGSASGMDRRETFIDDSSISKSGEDEQTYTDEEYNEMLITDGMQKLAALEPTEDFSGTLNVNGGVWRVGEDYNIGDIVTIQDNDLGMYMNVRITEITESQDENGYNVDVTYSAEAGL